MNVAATQYLLGVKPVLGGIVFEPCIPSEWTEYEVEREYRGVKLYIKFFNQNHKNGGVTKIKFADKEFNGNFLPFECIDGLNEANISVIL